MFKLCAIAETELTEYVIQLLHKHDICTIRDFLEADFVKLAKITNVSEESVIEIKRKIRQMYVCQPVQARLYYREIVQKSLVCYQTGISSLDALLKDRDFCGGRLIEICGLSGIGKSMLCTTIAVNFASNYDADVLYVDTKRDFSGIRVHRILSARNIAKHEMGKIMQQIKVERTYSAEGVIEILEQLLSHVKSRSGAGSSIKFVLIDSLPAVWFVFHGEEESVKGKYLLVKLANLMRKLAKEYFMVFMFVNLMVYVDEDFEETPAGTVATATLPSEDEQEEDNDSSGSYHSQPISKKMKLMTALTTEATVRPSLGKYWDGVPTMRLAMEEENVAASQQRQESSHYVVIRVMKSCYSVTGVCGRVQITDGGIL